MKSRLPSSVSPTNIITLESKARYKVIWSITGHFVIYYQMFEHIFTLITSLSLHMYEQCQAKSRREYSETDLWMGFFVILSLLIICNSPPLI